MGLIDYFKRKTIEKEVLADDLTQERYRQMTNQATSYMKSKEEVIRSFKDLNDKLTKRADYVEKKTIADWRSGLVSARDIDRPNRYWLLDLYAELELDPFLDSVVSYQKNKLTHIKRYIEDENGVVDEQATKLFNSTWFDSVISGYVDSQLTGFKVFEIDNIIKSKGLYTIDRLVEVPDKHIIPEFQLIKQDAYSDASNTFSYANDDYVIEIIYNNNRNLGKLSRLAPYLIWKKLAMNSWSNFIEDFGSPSMIIKTPIKNTDKENELLNSLQDIGSSLKMVLDTNDDFELMQPNSNDVYEVFQAMVKQVDDNIANEIVGGTLLFRNGDSGSYNLGSVQQSVSELKTAADLKDIEKYTNQFLIPKLQNLGLLDKKEYYLNFAPEEYLTMSARAAIDAQILPYANPTKEYLESTYKIKIDSMKEDGISTNTKSE